MLVSASLEFSHLAFSVKTQSHPPDKLYQAWVPQAHIQPCQGPRGPELTLEPPGPALMCLGPGPTKQLASTMPRTPQLVISGLTLPTSDCQPQDEAWPGSQQDCRSTSPTSIPIVVASSTTKGWCTQPTKGASQNYIVLVTRGTVLLSHTQVVSYIRAPIQGQEMYQST